MNISHTVYISVGSNLGDKHLNCQNGIKSLTSDGFAVLKAHSPFYMTEPVDYEKQDWFVNGIMKVETHAKPFELLKMLKHIEQNAGRDFNAIRFGPRVLDMDILLYDDVVVQDGDNLQIPHPRMHERRFVLHPLCDIAPQIIHPVLKKDMQSLLHQIDNQTQRIIAC